MTEETPVIEADRWVRKQDMWVRYHQKPRKALFAPTGTADGPPPGSLALKRITYVDIPNQPKQTITDEWHINSNQVLEHRWTGKTVFFLKPPNDAQALVAHGETQDGDEERVFVEGCCGLKSVLCGETKYTRACKLVRITEEDDLRSESGSARA